MKMTATIFWRTDKEALNYPNKILATEDIVEHPTSRERGALVRDVDTKIYQIYCNGFYSVPQDWADEKASFFKDELRTARLQAGLTRGDVEKITHVPIRTLANWETGQRRPPYYTKRMLIDKLNTIRNEKQEEFTNAPWKALKGYLEMLAEEYTDETEEKVNNMLKLADAPLIEWTTHSSKDIYKYIKRYYKS